MTNIYRLFYFTIIAIIAMTSCSGANDDTAAQTVSAVSRYLRAGHTDSLISMHRKLAGNYDSKLAAKVSEMCADSAVDLRATAIVVTNSPVDAAKVLMANPSKDFAGAIAKACRVLGDNNSYLNIQQESQKIFDDMSADEKAACINDWLQPEEAAAGMEKGDSALIEAMRKLYGDDPAKLVRFNNALPASLQQ